MALALQALAAPCARLIAVDVRRPAGSSVVASHSRVCASGRSNAKCFPVPQLIVGASQGQDGMVNVERPKEKEIPSQMFKQGVLPNRRRRGDSAAVLFDSWDPFSAGGLRQMMGVMDRILLDAASSGGSVRGNEGRFPRTPWDVAEDEAAFYIRVDMPGFGKDDVKVTVEDGVLVIKGERDPETTKDERWAAKTYQNFCTRLALPDISRSDKVTAELKHGVLNVIVPKMKPEDRKQVIDVHVS